MNEKNKVQQNCKMKGKENNTNVLSHVWHSHTWLQKPSYLFINESIYTEFTTDEGSR